VRKIFHIQPGNKFKSQVEAMRLLWCTWDPSHEPVAASLLVLYKSLQSACGGGNLHRESPAQVEKPSMIRTLCEAQLCTESDIRQGILTFSGKQETGLASKILRGESSRLGETCG
jgi:hypothetical protein